MNGGTATTSAAPPRPRSRERGPGVRARRRCTSDTRGPHALRHHHRWRRLGPAPSSPPASPRTPAHSVLLLEAGPDYPDVDKTPDDLQNSFWVSVLDHDWKFKADAVPGRAIEYPRGKVTGGSSAVNAAMAIRGVPSDFDEWADWATTSGAGSRSSPTSASSKTTGRWAATSTAPAAPSPSPAGRRRSSPRPAGVPPGRPRARPPLRRRQQPPVRHGRRPDRHEPPRPPAHLDRDRLPRPGPAPA